MAKGEFLSDYMDGDDKPEERGAEREEAPDKKQPEGAMELAEKAVAGDAMALLKLIRMMQD